MTQRNGSWSWKTEEWKSLKLNRKKGRINRDEDSFRDLWDQAKPRNIWILGVPGGEEREKGVASLCEDILAEHFANLAKEMGIQVLEHREP